MIVMKRLNDLEKALGKIEGSVAELPAKWRELGLRSRLVDISTSIEMLRGAETRTDPSATVSQVEKDLHRAFNQIHDGLCTIVVEGKGGRGLGQGTVGGPDNLRCIGVQGASVSG